MSGSRVLNPSISTETQYWYWYWCIFNNVNSSCLHKDGDVFPFKLKCEKESHRFGIAKSKWREKKKL